MPLTKDQKKVMLEDLVKDMKDAKAVVFSRFAGVSVKNTKVLRKQLRDAGVKYRVCKKTLIRIAAKEMGIDEISAEILNGPVSVAFSMEDEVVAAKLINTFSKKNEGIQLVGAIVDGKLMNGAQAKALASLPGKQELLAKFVYVLKSPIQNFHGVLNNTLGNFVRVLNAISEKKAA